MPRPADAVGALHTPLTLQELDPSPRYFPDLDLLDAGLGEERVPRRVRIRSSNIQQKACVLPVTDQTGDFAPAPRGNRDRDALFERAPDLRSLGEPLLSILLRSPVTPLSAITPLYRYLPPGPEVHTITALTLQVLRTFASVRHASTARRTPRSRSSYSPTLRATRARRSSAREA